MSIFAKIMAFIAAAMVQGTPLLFGATGEIITEKSGNLNLGIPGIMYIGGISGIIGGYLYEHFCAEPVPILCVVISFLASIIGSTFIAFIYSFLTISSTKNDFKQIKKHSIASGFHMVPKIVGAFYSDC